MKRRYTIDANTGLLVDRDGNSLGRVVGITIETTVLGNGGSASLLSKKADQNNSLSGEGVGEPRRPTATQIEREAVKRVWAYYLEVIPSKRVLDSKRERMIRNAIGLVGEAATQRAILGLSRSPWHNGENPDRRRYLEVRHALKGRGDESDDERIEKAIGWAAIYAPNTASMDEAKVMRLLEDVRYTRSLPHRPERVRGEAAYRRLQQAGFKIIPLDAAPWARLER